MSGTATNIVFGLQATNTVKVGACGAVEADAVDVGYTDGGVKMERSEEQFDIKVDQIVGAIESYTVDDELKITVALAEASVENLAIAFGLPTTAVSDGVLSFGGKTSNTNRTIYLNTKGINGGNRKTTLYKCKPDGNTSPAYLKGDKTMIDVTFKVLVDTSETAEGMRGTITETGTDTTAPTVAMTTPADGATVAKDAKSTVLLSFTETNAMDANSLVYGDTIIINNITTPASAVFVAGSISYDKSAKTVLFTPTDNWTGSDTLQLTVSTGVRDANGNNLAAPFIGQFDVAA